MKTWSQLDDIFQLTILTRFSLHCTCTFMLLQCTVLQFQANPSIAFVFVVSTYTDGLPPENSTWFHTWLNQSAADFRVSKALLKDMRYSVCAIGNSEYKDHFCKVSTFICICHVIYSPTRACLNKLLFYFSNIYLTAAELFA